MGMATVNRILNITKFTTSSQMENIKILYRRFVSLNLYLLRELTIQLLLSNGTNLKCMLLKNAIGFPDDVPTVRNNNAVTRHVIWLFEP